jgi:hypothetical protein
MLLPIVYFFFFFLLFEEVKNRFKVSNKERFVRLRKNEPVRRNTKTKIEKQNFLRIQVLSVCDCMRKKAKKELCL